MFYCMAQIKRNSSVENFVYVQKPIIRHFFIECFYHSYIFFIAICDTAEELFVLFLFPWTCSEASLLSLLEHLNVLLKHSLEDSDWPLAVISTFLQRIKCYYVLHRGQWLRNKRFSLLLCFQVVFLLVQLLHFLDLPLIDVFCLGFYLRASL